MPRITILLAHERSGSHLLGDFLGSLGGVRVFDEVCNPRAVRPSENPASFFRFRHQAISSDPDLMLNPDAERHAAFVRSYFEHLQSLAPSDNIVVQIKYGHVHNFESFWWRILDRPYLLRFCEQEDVGVIHLSRPNVMEATASGMIANRRNVWHSSLADPEQEPIAKMRFHAKQLARNAALLRRQIETFEEWTSAGRRLSVTYDVLVKELGGCGALDESLAAFTGGLRRAPFSSVRRKVTPPLPDVLENYEEIARACREAGLL